MTVREYLMKLRTPWNFTEDIMLKAWTENKYALSTLDRTCYGFRPISLDERETFEITGPAFMFRPKGMAQMFIVYCVPFVRDITEYQHPRIKSVTARRKMLKRIPAAGFRATRDDGDARRSFSKKRNVA